MSTSSEKRPRRQVADFADFAREWRENPPAVAPSVVLVYPVLALGAPADVVAPHSLYYLATTLNALGVPARIVFWKVGAEAGEVGELPRASVYYFHPMFATVESCCGRLHELRKRTGAFICLGNSDQHQHEMCLGGRQSREIARRLMTDFPAIDLVLLGRNHEYSLARLVANLASRLDPADGLGLGVLRQGEELADLREDRVFSLASLPLLDLPPEYPPVVRIRGSVGCRAVCAYCIESGANNLTPAIPNWSGMEAERFVAEMERIALSTGRRFFNIIDSSFEDAEERGGKRLDQMIRLILERHLGLSLKIHLRAETIARMTPTDLDRLKQAGVDVIIIGVESGVPTELKLFGKLASAGEVETAFRKIDADGRFFAVMGHMMFTPITTIAFLREKLDFLARIGRTWDFMAFSNWLLVYWGSHMHEILRERGLVEDDKNPFAYVGYRFADQRTRKIAAVMDWIKRARPEVMILHKLFYDCDNALARWRNPANAHLAGFTREMEALARRLLVCREEAGALYTSLFAGLVARADADEAEMRRFAASALAPVPVFCQDLSGQFAAFRDAFLEAGSDTSALFVDTWFSNVNVFGLGEAA